MTCPTKGTLTEAQPETPPLKAEPINPANPADPSEPSEPSEPSGPSGPSEPSGNKEPDDFHSGQALARRHSAILDSRNDPTVDLCRATKEEMAAEYFTITSAATASAYFSDTFLNAHPEFRNPGDMGADHIFVYRYNTTRDNSHLQLNFVEMLKTCLSIDVTYFTFGTAATHPMYTQMIAVWLPASAAPAATPVRLHVHSETR